MFQKGVTNGEINGDDTGLLWRHVPLFNSGVKKTCILFYVLIFAIIIFYYEKFISHQLLQIIATNGPP